MPGVRGKGTLPSPLPASTAARVNQQRLSYVLLRYLCPCLHLESVCLLNLVSGLFDASDHRESVELRDSR